VVETGELTEKHRSFASHCQLYHIKLYRVHLALCKRDHNLFSCLTHYIYFGLIVRLLISWMKINEKKNTVGINQNKSYFYDVSIKMWPFNTGDCLIEVTTWSSLIVFVPNIQVNSKISRLYDDTSWFLCLKGDLLIQVCL
jgi:hypothetical protein